MLWSQEEERKFFKKELQKVKPQKLFYKTDDGRYLAYWPKNYSGKKITLQNRNAYIGRYTEEWVEQLLSTVASQLNACAKRNVVCEKIGLTKRSPADVAIVKTSQKCQEPEDILLLVEVKMSIVWNWEYLPETGEVKCIGDYTTHQGNPGLLRSDTMLKAIGKSINIRVSGYQFSKIPIIVIGNTPITHAYCRKVDLLKQAGIIQGFFSLNPNPLDDPAKSYVKYSPKKGFLTIDNCNELYKKLKCLINEEQVFFSSMLSKKKLSKIIEKANHEPTCEKKAEMFLKLLREIEDE